MSEQCNGHGSVHREQVRWHARNVVIRVPVSQEAGIRCLGIAAQLRDGTGRGLLFGRLSRGSVTGEQKSRFWATQIMVMETPKLGDAGYQIVLSHWQGIHPTSPEARVTWWLSNGFWSVLSPDPTPRPSSDACHAKGQRRKGGGRQTSSRP